MPEVIFLGTGAAVTDAHRNATMIAVGEADQWNLIDCGGDAFQRLQLAGVDPKHVHRILLTHHHPDHLAGLPLYLERAMLAGALDQLVVYAPPETLRCARALLDAFSAWSWPGLPALGFREVAMHEDALVDEDMQWRITSSPVDHNKMPTVAYKVSHQGRSHVVFGADTAPCDALVRLAKDADVLIHEATGEGPGHSSAQEAAGIAARASVGRLFLTHLPAAFGRHTLKDVRTVFAATQTAEELLRVSF